MGRKGVSKQKRSKEKTAPGSGNNAASGGRKADNQPALVTEKEKPSSKGNKKG